MKRRADQATVAFIARISPSDKQAIASVLPMWGGRTWATDLAVQKFCELCESNPLLQARVHDLIEQMKGEDPPLGPEDFEPRISRDSYERFNSLFGQKGATTWFLRNWVPAFVEEMAQYPLLDEIVERSVRGVLKLAPTP